MKGMELKEGTYTISQDLKAVVVNGNTIIISKRKISHDNHCRDCVHCLTGKYKFSPKQWWESNYCDARPKIIGGQNGFFYAAPLSKKACELFKQNGEDKEKK